MKINNLVCLLFAILALSAVGCSSSSTTDDTGDETGTLTAPTSVVDQALSIMPQIQAGAGASISAMMTKAWTAGDKTTYRNDLAFNVAMRFMDPDTVPALSVGNESLINNLDMLYAPEFVGYATGTTDVTGPEGTASVTVGESIAAGSDVVSPITFGLTPFNAYQYARKISIDDFGMADYIAWAIVDSNILHIVDSSTDTAENSTQATVIYANFDNTTKDLNFYYASNVDYTGALVATMGENFIVRMDLSGNETTKEFTMKTTLREIKAEGSEGAAGGFAMIAKGFGEGADKYVAIKAKNGCDGTDAADWLDAMADSGSRWFCMKSELTVDELETFVKSVQNSVYTDTSAIEMQTSYANFTLSADCVTYGAAIAEMDYIQAADTSMPSDVTEYSSTFGVE